MAENVVINFEANTQSLLPAVTLLEKLGQIDKATADTFVNRPANTSSSYSNGRRLLRRSRSCVNRCQCVKVDNGLAKGVRPVRSCFKDG